LGFLGLGFPWTFQGSRSRVPVTSGQWEGHEILRSFPPFRSQDKWRNMTVAAAHSGGPPRDGSAREIRAAAAAARAEMAASGAMDEDETEEEEEEEDDEEEEEEEEDEEEEEYEDEEDRGTRPKRSDSYSQRQAPP